MSDVLPTIDGPYTPDRLLATGSQSQVWIAHGADGEVILKVARTEANRAALAREAQVLSQADHPGLPTLLESDPDAGWLALERIEGSQIDQWAQVQGTDEILRGLRELVDILEYLHGLNVIHGDIKPSNVLIDEAGGVHLIDLGVATLADTPSEFRGTLGYAAPERLRGQPAAPQSDYYGLAALLYTCLTGRAPFVAEDPAALTYLPLVSLPCPPTSLVPTLPAGFDRSLLKLLSRQPSLRPQTADEVRALLDSALDGGPGLPVLGMDRARESLRRAVVGAADGEPRVAVVYGPAGSGRRTLISEAIAAARREGMSLHKVSEIRTLLEAVKSSRNGVVVALRGTSVTAQRLAEVVLREKLHCLLLLHSNRPLPSLVTMGAVQMTPTPLTALDVTRLCRMHEVDDNLATEWWQKTMGLPGAVMGHIRRWKRSKSGSDPDFSALPAEARDILQALQERGVLMVPVLADLTKMQETELLEHCEPLFAEGLIEPMGDGEAIGLVDFA